MDERKNSLDDSVFINDSNPHHGHFSRQMSARDDSPKFGKNKINSQSTLMPHSQSGTLSVFDKNRMPLGSESIAFSGSNLKNFSIMNVSYQFMGKGYF
jgi:hypothetical protein